MNKTGITTKLWLFMLEHGGRWTVSELAEQFAQPTAAIDKIVWSMEGVGSITRYRNALRKNGVAYGVSIKNRIPQRMLLADVLTAVGVRSVINDKPAAANDNNRTAA